MAREKLFRVQHPDDGRGPFRPGFSKIWVDVSDLPRPPIPDDDPGLPDLYELRRRVDEWARAGYYCGYATRSLTKLRRWFTESEMRRLARRGYRTAVLSPDVILAESEHQVLFGRLAPLAQRVRYVELYPGTEKTRRSQARKKRRA